MRLRLYDRIVDNCKRLAQMHQFHMEPYLLLLNCLSQGGLEAHKAFENLQLQKFIHRELTIHDALVKGQPATYSKKMLRWTPVVKVGMSRRLGDEAFRQDGQDEGDVNGEEGYREETVQFDEEDETDELGDMDEEGEGKWAVDVPRPTAPIPHLNVIYALHMLSSKAYQSALCQYRQPLPWWDSWTD
jgi:general transcription factor 3C polypeptide 3 (transcription factor C subunit 4)